MKIEFTKSPASIDIDFLTQKINQETPELGEAYPFAFFIRDENNQIIAGCNGSVIFGSIYTDQLWVHPDHRGNGLGHKLMAGVHDYGRENGCSMATVATMSFQSSKAFYEKLGYEVDFERSGYTQNSSCLFLKRSL
jgi:GNAT superfamily N-acetyltransferase